MKPTLALLAFALFALGTAAPALAQQPPVEIDVSGGQVQPLPIAAPAFAGADARTSQLGGQIARVMAADLERSGFFRALPQAAFPQASLDIAVQPDLTAWRTAGAQALVNGLTTIDADGRLRVDFRLWDVGSGAGANAGGQGQLLGLQFTSTPENLAAHGSQGGGRGLQAADGGRTGTSTPASSSSPRAAPGPSAPSASPSWTRTARTPAS